MGRSRLRPNSEERHDHRKPRWRREYEAEMWAHAALRRHGVAVPKDDEINAMMHVFFQIEDAYERGRFGRPKRIAAEAAEWSGWNLCQELERLEPDFGQSV
jgi:hypothetical protein